MDVPDTSVAPTSHVATVAPSTLATTVTVGPGVTVTVPGGLLTQAATFTATRLQTLPIPNRRIHLAISDAEMAKRRAAMDARGAAAWKPGNRARKVSAALQAYAAMTTSADTGAVRDVSQLGK